MRSLPDLLFKARGVLSVGSQGALGQLLGSSRTSGQRWERKRATPSAEQLHTLVGLVYPKDPDLAEEIAAAAGTTTLALGLNAPKPQTLVVPIAQAVDLVVCAAADAMQMTPRAVRPAVRAAVRRALAVGLTLEMLDDTFGPQEAEVPSAAV